jgi:HEAT repeat protein
MARSALAHYTAPGESHVAAQALSLLVNVLGEGALTDLQAVMDSGEPKLRGAALEMAAPLGGKEATASWIEKARSSAGEVRAGIIAMLGRRGDRDALPYIRESLTGPDPAVRTAAIPAAARLGGEAVLADIFARFGSEDEAELAVLRDTLLGFSGSAIVPEAVRRLEATAVPGKSVLIDLIGEKGAREEAGRIFALAGDPDPAVRSAAVRALAKLAGEEDLPRLVKMLASAADADDVLRLQEAAASAAGRNPDPEGRAVPLLALMDEAPPEEKVAILRVLPALGGTKALQSVVDETRNPDARVRGVAILSLARWPDLRASVELLRIAKETTSPRDQLLAMEGYVRMVGRSPLPNRRKLELLRAALEEARDDTAARPVLAGLAEVREPESFRLLADHLGRPALAGAAAAGLVHMASSQAGAERWLAGHEAISILRRVEAAEEDPAERERIARVIADRLRQGGFTPLFNGRGLDGWKGLVADPPKRAGMTPEELRAAQAEADERMRAHWKVEDGVLSSTGRARTSAPSAITATSSSSSIGRSARAATAASISAARPRSRSGTPRPIPPAREASTTIRRPERAPGEGRPPRRRVEHVPGHHDRRAGHGLSQRPDGRRQHRPRELLGARQADLSFGPDRAPGPREPALFQEHLHPEIPRDAAVPEITAAEAAEGFVPLFNGRDLEGWTGDTDGYVAENGKLVVHPERKGGNLYTEKEYADFVLRFDFKLTPAANNGLGVRAPLEGDAAYAGMEIQILEDGSPRYWDLRPYQYHGSIYGVVPARRGVLRPVGEWNSEEVTVRGRRVTVVVNGRPSSTPTSTRRAPAGPWTAGTTPA